MEFSPDTGIVIVVAIAAIFAIIAMYENILKEKDKQIKDQKEEIDYLCVLNTLPICGNFEDDLPSEERFDEMLDNILLQTNIKKEL